MTTPRFAKTGRLSSLAILSAGLLFLTAAAPASAEGHGGHFGGFHSYAGRSVRGFGPHELGLWRGGFWHHEWHNGLFGWWWLVAGEWYFYPTPIYPYPTVVSQTVVVEPGAAVPAPGVVAAPPPGAVVAPPGAPGAPMPASQTWWYCDNPAGYFPHVPVCSVPFRPVAPTP